MNKAILALQAKCVIFYIINIFFLLTGDPYLFFSHNSILKQDFLFYDIYSLALAARKRPSKIASRCADRK